MKLLRAFLGVIALLASSNLAPAAAAQTAAEPEAEGEAAPHPSLRLIGFTDAGFTATDADATASNSGFFQGQFVLHLASALSTRFTFFGEVSLSASDDAAYGHASASPGSYALAADVHRTMLKYSHSDALKLSIGRFHAPVSYWNTAFHHGLWLQTTVTRPRMLDFSSAFLPLHFTGAFAEGALPTGVANLSYLAGIGNGRGSGPGRPDAPADANNNRAWTVRLASRPGHSGSLEIGGAAYFDTVSVQYGERRARYGERIVNAYVAYTKEKPEILAEYLAVRHEPVGGTSAFTSWGAYVQLAWRLDPLGGRVKPYLRWEEQQPDADDRLMSGLGDTSSLVLGLRVDPIDLVGLKAEYQGHRGPGAPFGKALLMQASLTF